MSYVLGIDLGTSSLKGSVFNELGTLIYSSSCGYPLIQSQKGYSEQNPLEWINALDKVMEELESKVLDFGKNLSGISFSGQMHSLVLLDRNNQVIRNSILWNDVRTTEQCKRIMNDFGDSVLTITKNIALEGFTLPKILWVQEKEPENWEKVDKIMLPKDFLGMYLTGKFYTDYSDAAGTLLLDEENREWSQKICEKFRIPTKSLPEIYESKDYIGYVKDDIATRYRINKSVRVFSGGADNACGAIGAGIFTSEASMVSIGTSGVFLGFEENAKNDYEGKLHYFNHALENKYYSMGVTLAAGNSLSWFKDTFAPNRNFASLLEQVDKIKPGSEGLMFTPYISGERTPYVDSEIRGSFIGIDSSHTIDHFLRALLEGITYSLKDSQEIFNNITKKQPKYIVSIGGGAKNREWLQIQADIFNSTILTLGNDQGPSLGAAIIAAVGLNWYTSFDEASKYFIRYKDKIEPIPKNVSLYEEGYKKYKRIYPATKYIDGTNLKEKL
ncbi:xylulokinase [Aerococcaceae bacterium 50-4]